MLQTLFSLALRRFLFDEMQRSTPWVQSNFFFPRMINGVPVKEICVAEFFRWPSSNNFWVLLNCAPTSIQLHLLPPSSTQLISTSTSSIVVRLVVRLSGQFFCFIKIFYTKIKHTSISTRLKSIIKYTS